MARKPPQWANPWVPKSESAEEPGETGEVGGKVPARPPIAVPAPGLVTPLPDGGLPVWEPDPARGLPPWWWVPCHGGAGTTTLAAAAGGADAGRLGWPIHRGGRGPGVVLVTRTNSRGLEAAQHASRQWASGVLGDLPLWGLVAVADAPGRLPKALENWLKLVAGGVPRIWTVPWHEPWRLGETVEPGTAPKQVAKLAERLNQAAASANGRPPG